MPISGVTEYRVSTSPGVDGANDLVVRYTTSAVKCTGSSENCHHTRYFYICFERDDGDEGYDLSAVVGDFSAVMNELFVSGDRVELSVGGGKKVKTQFVRRGGTVTLTEDEAISVPFATDGGSGQSVSLTLSDTTTVSVAYDETTEQITVSGVAYDSGESFVIDGKKVTIVDI